MTARLAVVMMLGFAPVPASADRGKDREVVLAASDFYAATVGGATALAAADVATSLFYEGHGLRIDAVDRESVIGAPGRHELHELNFVLGDPHDLVAFRVGRQRVAGGFWLLVDGVAVRRSPTEGLTFELVGGVRAFSNGRAELILRPKPNLVPLLAVTASYRSQRAQLAASVVGTRDVLTLRRGLDPLSGAFGANGETSGTPITVTRELPELFIDASGAVQASQAITAFGGMSVGNRYEVELSPRPELLEADPALRSRLLRSLSVFAAIDHRMTSRHRVTWSLVTVRAKTTFQVTDDAVRRPSASFVEVGARYRFTASARVRWLAHLKLRERDGGLVVHPTAGLTLGPRSRGTTFELEVGAAVRTGVPQAVGFQPRRTWVVDASLRHRAALGELRLGVQYSDVLPGATIPDRDDAPVALQLYPYTLEAQQFAYARTFVERGHWFAGADLEAALGHAQLRAFVQFGYAR